MRPRAALRDWLQLARLSNAPPAATNALAGAALALPPRSSFPWPAVAAAVVSVVALYTAGMVLNDALDARIDARERPGRPIPSGRIQRSHACAAAAILFLIGLAAARLAGPRTTECAALLSAAVILYNLVHRFSRASVILMGACRGLAVMLGAVAVSAGAPSNTVLVIAVCIAIYTTAFSLLARGEAGRPHPAPVWLAHIPLIAAVAAIALAGPPTWLGFGLLAATILWLLRAGRLASPPRGRRPRTVPAILSWIAAFALIDAALAAQRHRPELAGLCILLFALTLWSHRRILGT